MPITGDAFDDVSQLNNLSKVKVIGKVVLPQDKVPENDSFSSFID